MKTFVLLPAYNEAQQIGEVIQACRQAGVENIIVVDDGSTDATAALAREHGAIVLTHFINRGVGAATQTGLEAARLLGADAVVTFDADGQHAAADIGKLLDALRNESADIVIGSRFLTQNRIPVLRRIFNFLANVITFLLAGIWLTDSQSGLRAFNRKALEQIKITANGYEFSSEIVREARDYNLRIIEIPVAVAYTPYSLGKGQNFATGLTTVFKLIIRSLMR